MHGAQDWHRSAIATASEEKTGRSTITLGWNTCVKTDNVGPSFTFSLFPSPASVVALLSPRPTRFASPTNTDVP